MISLVFEFALFFLVLFFFVPGMIISLKLMHNYSHQHKHAGWDKGNTA